MELRDYLRVLRQRWLTIALSVLVVTGIALLLTMRATPQYESTARLFVSTSESNTSDAYQGGLFSQQRVKSYSSLMTGGEMAGRVAEKLDDGTTAKDVMDRLSASVVPDTVVLSVSATDPSAKHAQRIAQGADAVRADEAVVAHHQQHGVRHFDGGEAPVGSGIAGAIELTGHERPILVDIRFDEFVAVDDHTAGLAATRHGVPAPLR